MAKKHRKSKVKIITFKGDRMPGKMFIEVPADVELQDPLEGGRLHLSDRMGNKTEEVAEPISFKLFLKRLLATPAFQEDYNSVLHAMEIMKELEKMGPPGSVLELAEDDWKPLSKATDMVRFLPWNGLLLPQLDRHFKAVRNASKTDPRKKEQPQAEQNAAGS